MKILVISDTHGLHDLVPDLPEADVFIHAGDFMNGGKDINEIIRFNKWLENVPVPAERRFVVAGNHDMMFDEHHISSGPQEAARARRHLTNCVYVEDEEVTVRGVKFYFSPWTPEFFGWGFNAARGEEISKFWKLIPNDTDVLVTHGPPYGILDQITPDKSDHLGCEDLNVRVAQIWPKYHIFGHIHGSRGMEHYGPPLPGGTTYVNASFLTERYRAHPGPGYFLLEI